MSSKSKSISELASDCRFTHVAEHGVTFATYIKDDTIFVSAAFTRLSTDGGPTDQFSRSRGRQISVGRIHKYLSEPFRCRGDTMAFFQLNRFNPVKDESGQVRPVTAALVVQQIRAFVEDYIRTNGPLFNRNALFSAAIDYITF